MVASKVSLPVLSEVVIVVPYAKWRAATWYAISRSKKVARQRGNGIADSLPSGSGNLNIHLGRQRLRFEHALHSLELS